MRSTIRLASTALSSCFREPVEFTKNLRCAQFSAMVEPMANGSLSSKETASERSGVTRKPSAELLGTGWLKSSSKISSQASRDHIIFNHGVYDQLGVEDLHVDPVEVMKSRPWPSRNRHP